MHRSKAGRGRSWTYLNYHAALAGWWRPIRQADVIVSMSPPITLGTMSSLIGTGKPTVYNVQDIFAEFLRATALVRNRLALGLIRAIERLTYSRTSALVTVGESQRRFLIGEGISPDKVITIENFADVDSISPRPVDRDYRRILGIPENAFCALYAGNFGLVNDLDLLLEAAARLSRRNDIALILAGGGREWARARERAKACANVFLVGYRPVEELPRLFAAADVGLVTLKKGLSSCSVPSKTYGILASGRPFVAAIDNDSDIAAIALSSGGGIAVDPGDARAFVSCIMDLAADRMKASRMGENGYRYVLANNTAAAAAERYETLFEHLAGCRRSRI